jgi:hypothetical protein
MEKLSNLTQESNNSKYEKDLNILFSLFNKSTVVVLYFEMMCCLLLNSFTIVNLYFNSTYRASKQILINLAISDMIYSSCIPFYSSQFISDRIHRSILSCVFIYILDVSSTIVINYFIKIQCRFKFCFILYFYYQAIVYNITGLILERYLFLKQKKKPSRSRINKIRVYILLLWSFAFGFSLIKAFHIETVNYDDKSICVSSMNDFYERIFAIVFLFVGFFVPYSIIIITSILIIKFLKNWSTKSEIMKISNITSTTNRIKNVADEPNEQYFTEISHFNSRKTISSTHKSKTWYFHDRKRMMKRSCKFILGIVFSFLCCWSPLWIIQLLLLFTQIDSKFLLILTNFSFVIVYLGGIINPLLFIILTKNFKFRQAKKARENESI